MSSPQERYLELLALAKSYLLQEYRLSDRILSDQETFAYFKSDALKRQEFKNQSPEKKPVLPLQPKQLPPQPLPTTTLDPVPTRKNSASTTPTPVDAKVALPSSQPHSSSSKKDLHALPKISSQQNKTLPDSKEIPPFNLELPPLAQVVDFSAMRKIIEEKFPQVRFVNKIPDDSEAQKLAHVWAEEKRVPQVLILAFDEIDRHQLFLKDIAKALEQRGIYAQIVNALKIEQNKEWQKQLQSPALQLVISSSSQFYHLSDLQKYYREGTKQGRYYLANCLLLLLADISFYFKEPSLKPSLWNAIKELLAKPFSVS